VLLLALSTGHKLGLGLAVAGFAGFSLIVSMLVPRYRPQFPGRGLAVFLVACVLLFVGMLAAVEIFGKEGGESEAKAEGAPTTETTATTTAAGTSTTVAWTKVDVKEVEFKITLAKSSLAAGSYTFEVRNDGNVPHDLVVKGQGMQDGTQTIEAGKSATLKVDLKPGSYELYCSIPGHKQAGMDLTLTVT
jgi:uncharacterized cupredoxin-like copper-binding protein